MDILRGRGAKLFSTVWASQDRVNIADLLMMHGVPERQIHSFRMQ